MAWQDLCGDKLVDAATAVATIQSGDVVHVAPYSTTPYTLCRALQQRVTDQGFRDIRVDHPAAFISWTEPHLRDTFELHDNYATPPNRAACHEGAMEYLPVGIWREYELPLGMHTNPDVFLVPVSPPDAKGYCSFGHGVWMSRTATNAAKRVIAEVREDFIRTFGENYIHLDEIDLIVEADRTSPSLPEASPPSEEEVACVEVINAFVSTELINDGDTVQMGVGTVSAALAHYLGHRNDLGIQTELITGGIVDLVKQGVVTGARKTWHRHKVVGSACVALDREELEGIHENPRFELYDFGHTDDLRQLIQLPNFVAVNNALVVDLSGQVSAEALDHRPFSGVGGQTVFMVAGAYSPGGRSVSVLPSSSVPSATGVRVSRIVPTLAPGTAVTVPRTYVDNVVTEYGVATLTGKTLKQRSRALAEIAHPEFREALISQAKALYGA